MSKIAETREFIPISIAVLTVSDTRTMVDDKSGDTLVARIAEAGHRLGARAIVPDDKERIAGQVREWTLNPDIDINGLNPGAPKLLNAEYGYHNGVFMLAHGTTTDLLNSMLRPEVVEFRAAMNKKETAEIGPAIALSEDEREQATLARTSLQDVVMQNTAQFLLGQRSFDTWDAYKTELENAGMSRYVELVNTAAQER